MRGKAPNEIWELEHNGVLIPEYAPIGFTIKYKGNQIKLTPEQEEMAVAWVKKLGTEYVEDPVFVKNFFRDFSKALGIGESKPQDFDFSSIQRWVEEEKIKKERMSREEKKKLAEVRKRLREKNKEKYGFAIINGERVEVGNYIVEPPGIFMGRGKHPLRGKWKPRIHYSDIILNLSPEAKMPPAPKGQKWGGRVFDSKALWIAKWKDKLTNKMKYVWISESAKLRQIREMGKYDTARKLDQYIDKVREHIWRNLTSDNELRRKVATVAYLIDVLKLRVGDEKDKDEADTVGATTLRGAHVKINSDGTVTFDFLGKDAVRWVKTIQLPSRVIENLRSFITSPRAQIFSGVKSDLVNSFLAEVMPKLTAKVFRTYHATKTVEEFLKNQPISPEEPQFVKKFVATKANLCAAIECNHKKKLPKNWKVSLEKKVLRLRALRQKLEELELKHKMACEERQRKHVEKLKAKTAKLETLNKRFEDLKNKNLTPARKKLLKNLRKRIREEKLRITNMKKEFRLKEKVVKARHRERIKKLREKIRIAKLKLDLAKSTKNYNLGTSLKSYIDPRVFVCWAKKLNYDWKDFYPKTLQKKFVWADPDLPDGG